MIGIKKIIPYCTAIGMAIAVTVQPLAANAQSNSRKLQSGFWQGGVRLGSTGNISSCYLAARNTSAGYTIGLLWNRLGLHILLYDKSWKLVAGEDFKARVKIDRRYDAQVDAYTATTQSIDYIFGFDEAARKSIQGGKRISLEGPGGKKSFRLMGTRAALDVILDCAEEYSLQGQPSKKARIQPEETTKNNNLPTNSRPANPTTPGEMVELSMMILAKLTPGTFEDAYGWADKAAKLGDRRGLWVAGRMAMAGVGTEINRTMGHARILLAAQAGHPEALTYIGLQYAQDKNALTVLTGIAYLKRAAAQSHAPAISALRFFKEESNR